MKYFKNLCFVLCAFIIATNAYALESKTLDMFDINKIQDFKIVSIKKCYPVYDTTYKENLEIVKKFLSPLVLYLL
jgi:protoporphyrinogen oxidase